jgi:hypothetical protein
VSAAMTEQPTLNPSDLRPTFSKKVATLVAQLVNDYGVRYRIQKDGGHILMYNGEQQNGPHKVSASRPEEDTLHWLNRWIDRNVPEYREREVTPATLKALAEAVNTTDTHEVEEPQVESSKWAEHKHGFETDGEVFRCLAKGCGYTRTDPRGLHLHALKHDKSRHRDALQQGTETRALKAEQKKIMVSEALRLLADAHGMVVIPKDEHDSKGLASAQAEVERLTAANEKLRKELDDTKARLDLIKQAMKA